MSVGSFVRGALISALCLHAFGCNQVLGIRERQARLEDAGALVISASCGDGVVDGTELCDGDCPASCDDGVACTADTLEGSRETCDAVCHNTPIKMCKDGDGCCPSGCDMRKDKDCAPACGNGQLDERETCDGDCPKSCDDENVCTTDTLKGSAERCNAVCSHTAIDSCVSGDGCCPAGCDANRDQDCSSTCGNGLVEPSETCDGNCPAKCDDRNACTRDALTGTAASCSALCTHDVVTTCQHGDGCCPAGCNATNDNDCPVVCGNHVVEAGESCDGNCPSSCQDNDVCTVDALMGAATTCSASCTFTAITACTSQDGCCPTGCDFHVDSDCGETWARRKLLTIDGAQVTVPLSGALSNFPVLIALDDPELAASARSDGRDIFFTAGDGIALLDFELTSYSAGKLVAWVRIPSLRADTATRLYMYYGDGKTWDRASSNATWERSFVGVWHLEEDPGMHQSGDVHDSSGAGNHGTFPASLTSNSLVPAAAGNGISLAATDGAISFGDIAAINGASALTASVWVRFNTLAGATSLVTKGDAANGWGISLTSSSGDVLVFARVDGSSDGPDGSTSAPAASAGSMQLFTLVFNGGGLTNADRLRLYVDGVLQSLTFRGVVPTQLPSTTAAVLLGGGLDGVVDELSLATVARSKAYIATHQRNVASATTFVAAGPEETH